MPLSLTVWRKRISCFRPKLQITLTGWISFFPFQVGHLDGNGNRVTTSSFKLSVCVSPSAQNKPSWGKSRYMNTAHEIMDCLLPSLRQAIKLMHIYLQYMIFLLHLSFLKLCLSFAASEWYSTHFVDGKCGNSPNKKAAKLKSELWERQVLCLVQVSEVLVMLQLMFSSCQDLHAAFPWHHTFLKTKSLDRSKGY